MEFERDPVSNARLVTCVSSSRYTAESRPTDDRLTKTGGGGHAAVRSLVCVFICFDNLFDHRVPGTHDIEVVPLVRSFQGP